MSRSETLSAHVPCLLHSCSLKDKQSNTQAPPVQEVPVRKVLHASLAYGIFPFFKICSLRYVQHSKCNQSLTRNLWEVCQSTNLASTFASHQRLAGKQSVVATANHAKCVSLNSSPYGLLTSRAEKLNLEVELQKLGPCEPCLVGLQWRVVYHSKWRSLISDCTYRQHRPVQSVGFLEPTTGHELSRWSHCHGSGTCVDAEMLYNNMLYNPSVNYQLLTYQLHDGICRPNCYVYSQLCLHPYRQRAPTAGQKHRNRNYHWPPHAMVLHQAEKSLNSWNRVGKGGLRTGNTN